MIQLALLLKMKMTTVQGTLDNNSEKQWILEHQQKISYLNVTIKADWNTPMTLRVFIANNITT